MLTNRDKQTPNQKVNWTETFLFSLGFASLIGALYIAVTVPILQALLMMSVISGISIGFGFVQRKKRKAKQTQ